MTGSRSTPAPKAPGVFITFEGGEGSGKSTQIDRLTRRLAALGYDTIATREPGGSPKAEQLREIILSGFVEPYGPAAEAIAFAAARIDHLDHTIRPALKDGCIVICDRFMDSTRAYQGASGKVDPALIAALEHVSVGDTRPDLTLILDLPPEEGLERARIRRGTSTTDRFENENLEFHRAVRKAFLDIAANEPDRCIRIYAGKSADDVEMDIREAVQAKLYERLGIADTEADGSNRSGKDGSARIHEGEPARMPRAPRLRVVSDSDSPRTGIELAGNTKGHPPTPSQNSGDKGKDSA